MGFHEVGLVPGWNMLGIDFEGLTPGAEENIGTSINDLLSGDFQNGDQIQCFDMETGLYRPFYYSTTHGEWRYSRSESADNYPVKPGTAFWLKTNCAKVLIKGSVHKETASFESQLQGYQLVIQDAPLPLRLNGENATWTNLSDGDEIQFEHPETHLVQVRKYSAAKGKWMIDRGTEASDAIDKGRSFWLKTKTPGVTFTIKQ